MPAMWCKRKWLLTGFLALLVLYTCLGFFIVPAIVTKQLPIKLSQFLKRQVTLEKVRINPFIFSISIDNFHIIDADNRDFLAWKQLYADFELISLINNTFTFKSIKWLEPSGRVMIAKNGRLNFSDILEQFQKEIPKQNSSKKSISTPSEREISIDHFCIKDLKLSLIDKTNHEPFSATLGPVGLDIFHFKTNHNSNTPYLFTATTDLKEELQWRGTFSAEPLQSQGEFNIKNINLARYYPYYRERVGFDLKSGTLDCQSNYEFKWSSDAHVIMIKDAILRLSNIAFAHKGQNKPELLLSCAEAKGIEMNLLENSLNIDNLKIDSIKTSVIIEPKGSVNLGRLFTLMNTQKKPSKDKKQFQLRLNHWSFNNFDVTFKDEMRPRPISAKIDIKHFDGEHFTLDPNCISKVDLDMSVDHKTLFKVKGDLQSLLPAMDLHVKLEQLQLPPFDPYFEPHLALRLNKGTLSGEGRFKAAFEGKKTDHLTYQGTARLENLEAMDALQQEVFLRYQSLQLKGIDLQNHQKSFKVQQTDIVGSEYRLVVAKDGTNNVYRALKIPSQAPATSQSAPPVGAAAPPTPKNAYKLAISNINIKKGGLSFIDKSITPQAALLIQQLEGYYKGMSTEPETKSHLSFKGLAGGLAPVLIEGQAKPLRHDQDTDITVKIEGAELKDFNPYAMKYLGYTLHKGKLGLNADIKIKKRQLKALLKADLNQCYLGEKVKSPDATKLPIRLALAILRDRKGVIKLELPMDGNLDSPDFHYGKIAWYAFLNVMTKVATSPFDLLAKAFGAEEKDLSFVAFAPGSAELSPEALKKLDALGQSMQAKPELSLELEGFADASDTQHLKEGLLETKLRQAKAASLAKGKNPPDASQTNILPEEKEQWLAVVYEAQFFKAHSGEKKQAVPPAAEMLQKLLGSLTVPEEQLQTLAAARSRQAANYLIHQAKLDASKVFEVTGSRFKQGEGGRVCFHLKGD